MMHPTLERVIADYTAEVRQSSIEQARAEPERFSRSPWFPDGLRYRCYPDVKRPRSTWRFCYSTTRNAAGRYLCWREIRTKNKLRRVDIRPFVSRSSACEQAKRAWREAGGTWRHERCKSS